MWAKATEWNCHYHPSDPSSFSSSYSTLSLLTLLRLLGGRYTMLCLCMLRTLIMQSITRQTIHNVKKAKLLTSSSRYAQNATLNCRFTIGRNIGAHTKPLQFNKSRLFELKPPVRTIFFYKNIQLTRVGTPFKKRRGILLFLSLSFLLLLLLGKQSTKEVMERGLMEERVQKAHKREVIVMHTSHY